jgi:hypothetical protein
MDVEADMENPWLNLPPIAPFVLPCDKADVNRHNAHPATLRKPSGALNLRLRPLPFVGNPNAPLVLLTLNPGDKPGDEAVQATPEYQDLSARNLRHAGGFYYLDDRLPSCPGKSYNLRQLRALIQAVGLRTVQEQVFLAQFSPYHSAEYVETGTRFHSQLYTFFLVRNAIQRGALVIALRSATLWLSAVSELHFYSGFFRCSNPRSPTVSPRSLGRGFELAVQALSKR